MSALREGALDDGKPDERDLGIAAGLEWRFPRSLPEFTRLFPDDLSCAKYLESVRWTDGFVCPKCSERGKPFRFAARPSVLRCRVCRGDSSLTAGTVLHRTHLPLTTWFWAASLVSTSTPGMSARQFQRQLGLTRYETAYQILHKLRAGIGGRDRRFYPFKGFRSLLGLATVNEAPSYDSLDTVRTHLRAAREVR